MPRYHFHVTGGRPDLDGLELEDDDAAREEAIKTSCDLVCELGKKAWRGERWAMDVVEQNGRKVARLEFVGQLKLF